MMKNNLTFKRVAQYQVITAFSLVALFVLLDGYPKINRIVELRKQKYSKVSFENFNTEYSGRNEEEGDKIIQIRNDFKVIEESMANLKKAAVEQKNIPKVTLFLEDLVASSGTEMTSIKTLESSKENQYEFVPMSVSINGQYGQLIDFLSGLENAPVPMAVYDMSIKANGAYPALNMDIVIYSLFSGS